MWRKRVYYRNWAHSFGFTFWVGQRACCQMQMEASSPGFAMGNALQQYRQFRQQLLQRSDMNERMRPMCLTPHTTYIDSISRQTFKDISIQSLLLVTVTQCAIVKFDFLITKEQHGCHCCRDAWCYVSIISSQMVVFVDQPWRKEGFQRILRCCRENLISC